MTDETMPLPPPGWYPDPNDAGAYSRYWDGQQWTARQLLPRQGVTIDGAPPHDVSRPVGRGFLLLSRVVGIGMVFLMITTVARFVLHIWGIGMIDDAVATGDMTQPNRFDQLNQVSSIGTLVLLILVGIGWMVWQYRLALANRGPDVRRSPGWHAWSWIIPVGSLWMPFQNLDDLWQRLLPQRPSGWLRVWWACWLISNGISWLIARSHAVNSVQSFKTATSTDAVSEVLFLMAGVLAIRLVRTLTTAAISREARSAG